mmetsp:Transcript_2217/g.7296  ORF Transcript_2217/g.7296 Transcript_2217/m.7296 type:complete len:202 (-) Transcript_2217:443-1048(-)
MQMQPRTAKATAMAMPATSSSFRGSAWSPLALAGAVRPSATLPPPLPPPPPPPPLPLPELELLPVPTSAEPETGAGGAEGGGEGGGDGHGLRPVDTAPTCAGPQVTSAVSQERLCICVRSAIDSGKTVIAFSRTSRAVSPVRRPISLGNSVSSLWKRLRTESCTSSARESGRLRSALCSRSRVGRSVSPEMVSGNPARALS